MNVLAVVLCTCNPRIISSILSSGYVLLFSFVTTSLLITILSVAGFQTLIAFSPASPIYIPFIELGLPIFFTSRFFAITEANGRIGMSRTFGFLPYFISNGDTPPVLPLHGNRLCALTANDTATWKYFFGMPLPISWKMLFAMALVFLIAFSASPFARCNPGGIDSFAIPRLLNISLHSLLACVDSPSIFIRLILIGLRALRDSASSLFIIHSRNFATRSCRVRHWNCEISFVAASMTRITSLLPFGMRCSKCMPSMHRYSM